MGKAQFPNEEDQGVMHSWTPNDLVQGSGEVAVETDFKKFYVSSCRVMIFDLCAYTVPSIIMPVQAMWAFLYYWK